MVGNRTSYIPWEQIIPGTTVKDNRGNRWLQFSYSPQSTEWQLQMSEGPTSALCLQPNAADRMGRFATAIDTELPSSETGSVQSAVANTAGIVGEIASATANVALGIIDTLVQPSQMQQHPMVQTYPVMMGGQHLPTDQPSILSQVSSEIVEIASDAARKTGNIAAGTVIAAVGAELAAVALPATIGPDMTDALQFAAGVTSAMLTPTITTHLCPTRDNSSGRSSHVQLRRSNMVQLDDVPNVQVVGKAGESQPIQPTTDSEVGTDGESRLIQSSELAKLRSELSKANELIQKKEIDLEKKGHRDYEH